ncbi:MAG TPA: phage holin family protein [Solirubrobacteraceae bacterium]|nr:phage holin family protein [Solirubrobacteraceae bacterium]
MGGTPGTRLILAWLGNSLGLLVAAAVIPAVSYGMDLGTLLLAGAILGLVNFAVRPLVILMTLPAVVLSLGIWLLFVNAFMLWLTSRLIPDLRIGGFWSTVAAALLIWLVNLALRPARKRSGDSDDAARVRVTRWRQR